MRLDVLRRVCLLVLAVPLIFHRAALADGAVEISGARVPPAARQGSDVPLLMRLANHAAEPDQLLRVRCPFVNFSVRHTVDHGEGAPSMREVAAIPLPAQATTILSTDGFHIMLLQTRQTLATGDTFTCTAGFKRAGTISFEVHVLSLSSAD